MSELPISMPLELHTNAMKAEEPFSLLSSCLLITSKIFATEINSDIAKKITFFSYDLLTQCENLSSQDKLQKLNQFFFETKGFCIQKEKGEELSELLIENLVQNGKGTALTAAILYSHLAAKLDLTVYLCCTQCPFVLKWLEEGRSSYINLMEGGKLINENEIYSLLNAKESDSRIQSFEILPSIKVFSHYCNEITQQLVFENRFSEAKLILDKLLEVEPESLNLLGQRALISKSLNCHDEALDDLKRYYSFTDFESSSQELQSAYLELECPPSENPC